MYSVVLMLTGCCYGVHRMSRESSASRLAIHDKVRGSITSLQESLFAGTLSYVSNLIPFVYVYP